MRLKGDAFFTPEAVEQEPEMDLAEPQPEGPVLDKGAVQKKGGDKNAKNMEPVAVQKTKGIDVIILMHLPRGHDMNYSFDFDNRWTYGFVDSVIPASTKGLLNVEEMMGSNMMQMVNRVDLAKVLGNNFRYAMARLVYLYQRSNEDVRGQIALTINCLEDTTFIGIIKERILSMVEDYKLELDLSQITDQKAGVALVGTFQEALHRQFTDALAAMFAVVLSHMDRNFGLRLYKIPECQRIWIYLFGKSFKEIDEKDGQNVQERRKFDLAHSQFILEVPSDGRDRQPFASKFPYSFYLSDTLQRLRLVAETVASGAATDGGNTASLTSSALQRQFELLAFEQDLSGPLSESMINRYAFDFTCMHLMNSIALPKETQTEMLFRVLELYQPAEPLLTLAAIHARYWDCETRLNLYCQLLDAVPAAVQPVKDMLLKSSIEACTAQTGVNHPTASVDLAVLALVLDMVLPTNSSQQWETSEDYGRWCTQYDLAKPAVLSLIEEVERGTGASHAAVLKVTLHWEKLRLVDQFIRDIALPLTMPMAASLAVITDLLKHEIRTQAVFRTLVELLCQQLAEDVDRKLAEQLNQLQSGLVQPTDAAVEVDAKEREKLLRRGTAALMEVYIFEMVFSVQALPMEPALATDFVTMLAQFDLHGLSGVSARYDLLLPSEAGRVALMTALVHVDSMKELVQAKLYEVLQNAASTAGFLDTTVAQTYLAVLENDAAPGMVAILLSSREEGEKLVRAIDLGVFNDAAVPIWTVLGQVATIRRLLLTYAQAIAKCVEPPQGAAVAEEDTTLMLWLKSQVDPILSASSGLVGCLRSVRMHLLKTMERTRGFAFVRSAMQQPPLHDAPWLQEWIELNDLGLVRFMGSNKLPQNNPFTQELLYEDVSRAATEFLTTGNLTALNAVVAELGGNPRLKTALGVVFFQEFGLLNVLPDAMSGDVGARVIKLHAWIRDDAAMSFCTETERRILSFTAGDLKADGTEAGRFLALDTSSNPEKIVTVRLLAHLAARAIAAAPGEQLCFFRAILTNLGEFAPSEENPKSSYWPTMPDDPLFMVQKALMEAGDSRGAKRWFTCPNGHPFAIGQCGAAMEKARCPECNEEIGGGDHTLLSNNKALNEVGGNGNTAALFQTDVLKDNSDPGYCLRTAADEKDRFFAARDLSAQALRLVRILMHGCLVLGSVVVGVEFREAVGGIVNKGYTTSECSDAPGDFFMGHLLSDWVLVKELMDVSDDQVALLLHEVLLRTDVPEAALAPVPPAPGGADEPAERRPQGEGGGEDPRAGQADPGAARAIPDAMRGPVREQVLQLQQRLQALAAEAAEDPEDEELQREVAEEMEETRRAQQELMALGGVAPAGGQPPKREQAPSKLTTPEERGKWESMFNKNVVAELVAGEGKAQRLRDIEQQYSAVRRDLCMRPHTFVPQLLAARSRPRGTHRQTMRARCSRTSCSSTLMSGPSPRPTGSSRSLGSGCTSGRSTSSASSRRSSATRPTPKASLCSRRSSSGRKHSWPHGTCLRSSGGSSY